MSSGKRDHFFSYGFEYKHSLVQQSAELNQLLARPDEPVGCCCLNKYLLPTDIYPFIYKHIHTNSTFQHDRLEPM